MAANTILVADDDRAIRTVLSEALGRLGHQVRTAGDAATLWRWVKDGAGDLVITDVVLPGMNGKELVARLRVGRPGLRCLYMSGYTADVIAQHGVLDAGVAFLQKPFTIQSLAEKAREALKQPLET